MKLIQTQTLASASSTISLNDIPQTFTDIMIVLSGRSTSSPSNNSIPVDCLINGSSSDMTGRYLEGTGSAAASATDLGRIMGLANSSTNTANTFSSSTCYIPNYTNSTTAKSWSVDASNENNATFGLNVISANLWNPSTKAAITSIRLDIRVGSFEVGTTVSLYGIGGAGDGYAAPRATGGVITRSGGYIIHTFFASGTFTPTANLTAEYLVVAGGGGGGRLGGGGGAGGYLTGTTSVTSGTNYTVTVGSGGAGSNSRAVDGVSGTSSVFSAISTSGGGGGGSNNRVGSNGGSGGGGAEGAAGGTGVSGQGFAGGAGASVNWLGGGGGASQTGFSGVSSVKGGDGGAGLSSTITGTSITRAGGGGGGAESGTPAGSGGAGGGGAGGAGNNNGVAGTANTGGGGGGSRDQAATGGNGANGGSGIVIVRYAA